MRWRVSWEMPPVHWAAEHKHVKDLGPLWDSIPWMEKRSERETDDEASARSQYKALAEWERTKIQPIRNVRLECADSPVWRPA